jgi:hypothetical protein
LKGLVKEIDGSADKNIRIRNEYHKNSTAVVILATLARFSSLLLINTSSIENDWKFPEFSF